MNHLILSFGNSVFYQIPHCNGMGYREVIYMATLRAIKAEGGWGVFFTKQVEIHHTSEITPFIKLQIKDYINSTPHNSEL